MSPPDLAPPGGASATGGTGMRRVSIIQGERGVSDDPRILFATVLGSCVAACLFDPDARVGGLNHFLLGEPQPGQIVDSGAMHRYGVNAMELLINDMLRKGARRERLRAHLYGGANMHAGMRTIGAGNADFAIRFLQQERIPLVARDLGGTAARRVEFQAALGRSRAKLVPDLAPPPPRAIPAVAADTGDLELF